MRFEKPACTTERHCEILRERGLIIEDAEKAKRYLDQIGYYRLTGYMYPFQSRDGDHQFKNDITFQLIVEHYLFDKKLRLLLLDAIERIEISIRSKICNVMCLAYGAHWYMDRNLFVDQSFHSNFILEIKKNCAESSELFIRKYASIYTEPELPPAWMIMETISFRKMAMLYRSLRDTDEKKAIARSYSVVVNIFESWLLSLNFVRNCCAHHLRLWNRRLPVRPIIPKRKNNRFLENITEETDRQLYGILSCMLFLLHPINANSRFKDELIGLFKNYPTVNISYMGFQEGWESEKIWSK